ncbi:DUF1990 family protein [Kitasatospora sp. NPDC057223]|uniref:DUF1990 family protein n=1 Tax=Kitasatospora sp. NPDC057223 TaxID=3346055 RepID=UPI00362E186D
MNTLSYPDRLASTPLSHGSGPAPLPAGYQHLRHRVLIGHGRDTLRVAGAAVTGWQMHRAAGLQVRAGTDRATPGTPVECAIGIGRLRVGASCEVVWAADEPDLIGFAYGTRTGHIASGEETFLVEMDADKAVWFSVTAFSRPDRWFTRAAGPLLPLGQRFFARRCGQVLTRIVAAQQAAPAPAPAPSR